MKGVWSSFSPCLLLSAEFSQRTHSSPRMAGVVLNRSIASTQANSERTVSQLTLRRSLAKHALWPLTCGYRLLSFPPEGYPAEGRPCQQVVVTDSLQRNHDLISFLKDFRKKITPDTLVRYLSDDKLNCLTPSIVISHSESGGCTVCRKLYKT